MKNIAKLSGEGGSIQGTFKEKQVNFEPCWHETNVNDKWNCSSINSTLFVQVFCDEESETYEDNLEAIARSSEVTVTLANKSFKGRIVDLKWNANRNEAGEFTGSVLTLFVRSEKVYS